jgi:DNA-binding HxlR family transcriptional regulator
MTVSSTILLLRKTKWEKIIASNSKARTLTPLPGRPARGSQTGRPVMALLDLLGRRWALRVLWELRDDQTAPTFRELQANCGDVSSSVLNERLRELRGAGIATVKPGGGYILTPEGHELMRALAPLDEWASGWAARAGRAEPLPRVAEA